MKLHLETSYSEFVNLSKWNLNFLYTPGDDDVWHKKWIENRVQWWEDQGYQKTSLDFSMLQVDDLAHYSKSTVDIMYQFPHGEEELEGIANRTDLILVHILRIKKI